MAQVSTTVELTKKEVDDALIAMAKNAVKSGGGGAIRVERCEDGSAKIHFTAVGNGIPKG